MAEIIKRDDSRRQFIDMLIQLAEQDERVVLIVPDVGFLYIEEFQKRFPKRFFNFGVTEQSTITIAVGLALSGFKPYVYSMINFVAFRPFEMVRNGVAMHKANVTLVGVKGSEKYRFLGFSHNLLFEDEDTYHLKPYMTCRVPDSLKDVRIAIREAYEKKEPNYLRL